MAITGTGAGLAAGAQPGRPGGRDRGGHRRDGSRIRPRRCTTSAPLLAGELRRAGPDRAHAGRIVHRGPPGPRATSGRGWPRRPVAADMESAPLAAAADGPPAGRDPGRLRHRRDARCAPRPRHRRAGRAALAARSRPGAGPLGGRVRAAAGAAGRAAVVLRRGGAGHRDRRAGAGAGRARRSTCASRSCTTPTWCSDLEQRGAIFVDELDEVPDGAPVVFSAHGVSPGGAATRPTRRGLSVVDATCPLVAKVHKEARRFADDGYLVALIGHAGHEEVEGTLGEAPRLDRPGRDRRRTCRRCAADDAGQGRLPDADHAGRGRGRGGGQRAAGPVPRGPRAAQRRHLLRDDQPAAGRPRRRRRVRPGAGGRLGQLVELPCGWSRPPSARARPPT